MTEPHFNAYLEKMDNSELMNMSQPNKDFMTYLKNHFVYRYCNYGAPWVMERLLQEVLFEIFICLLLSCLNYNCLMS